MKDSFTINGRSIGLDQPTYIIAEMSANHHQSFSRAVEIIHAMKDAGADAVKVQTYTPDTMTINCNRKEFTIGEGTLWKGKTLYDLYGEACTPWEWQPKLKELSNRLGMDFFSTPFDLTAVDFLEIMGVPAYKIASFELVDTQLIECVAKTGKPVIISTGMGSATEIQEAVDVVRSAGNEQLVLLKCTSAYPAPAQEANLRTIPDMRHRFGVPIGLSDHTMDIELPIAAVTLGACIIEKHFCLSRQDPGPDSAFSLEPAEFKKMAEAIRTTEKALGKVSYERTEKEQASMVFRRSLFAVNDIRAGETLTAVNIRSIRPGYGLPPKYLKEILGQRAKQAILRGTPLTKDMVQYQSEASSEFDLC